MPGCCLREQNMLKYVRLRERKTKGTKKCIFTTFPSNGTLLRFVKRYSCNLIGKKVHVYLPCM